MILIFKSYSNTKDASYFRYARDTSYAKGASCVKDIVKLW